MAALNVSKMGLRSNISQDIFQAIKSFEMTKDIFNLGRFFMLTPIFQKKVPNHVNFFEDWSQSEKLSEIKLPLVRCFLNMPCVPRAQEE